MRKTRGKRRAFLLVETVMAGLLVALAMTLTVGLLSWVGAERRASERRGWAAQEAANGMERLTALPFDRLTSEVAKTTAKLSDAARGALPDSRLIAEVRDSDDGLPLKRIDLEVRWRGRSGLDEAPVRLTSWVARKEAH